MTALVIDTDQRFELELAIADWQFASELKSESAGCISRLLEISLDDAIGLADQHQSAQQMLDALGTEVVSYRLTAEADDQVDGSHPLISRDEAIASLADNLASESCDDVVSQINDAERSTTMFDRGDQMLGYVFASVILAGFVVIVMSSLMDAFGIECRF